MNLAFLIVYMSHGVLLGYCIPIDSSGTGTVSLKANDVQKTVSHTEKEEGSADGDSQGFIGRESIPTVPRYSLQNTKDEDTPHDTEPFVQFPFAPEAPNRYFKRSNDRGDLLGKVEVERVSCYDGTLCPLQRHDYAHAVHMRSVPHVHCVNPVGHSPQQVITPMEDTNHNVVSMSKISPRSRYDDVIAQLSQDAVMHNILPTMRIPFVRNVVQRQYQCQMPVPPIYSNLYNSVSDSGCGIPILLTCSPNIYLNSFESSAFSEYPSMISQIGYQIQDDETDSYEQDTTVTQ